jgi:hypothetical protein
MIDENKITKVLSQINRDTKEGKITWQQPDKRPKLGLSSNEELVGKIYETEFNNRGLRLYKINERIQTDEYEFNWVPSFKLEILDEYDNVDWEFPYHRGIIDLFESVRFKVSDVESFFNSINDDEPTF